MRRARCEADGPGRSPTGRAIVPTRRRTRSRRDRSFDRLRARPRARRTPDRGRLINRHDVRVLHPWNGPDELMMGSVRFSTLRNIIPHCMFSDHANCTTPPRPARRRTASWSPRHAAAATAMPRPTPPPPRRRTEAAAADTAAVADTTSPPTPQPRPTSARPAGDRRGQLRPPTLRPPTSPSRLGLLPQRDPRAGDRRRGEGALRRGARRRHARDRPPSTPARRPSRRCSPTRSTSPTSARTRRSTPSPSPTVRPPDRRRLHLRRRVPRRRDGDHSRRRPQGQDDRHAAAGQHPGRGAPRLAEGRRARDRHAPAAVTSRSCRRPTPTRSTAFKDGDIDGAWVPEPWATRLVHEGGGKVLVDEADLWPDGQFVTTHLIVRTEFLEEHPDIVKASDRRARSTRSTSPTPNPAEAQAATNAGIEKITDKPLAEDVIAAAWKNLTSPSTRSPPRSQKSADDAEAVGLLDAGRPRRHLRPDAPQRGARRARPAGGRGS